MSRLTKIVTAVAVLVVGSLAAGVAILKSMDFNEYRATIAERLQGVTGRQVEIAGDLNLDISLNPALSVQGISLANTEWGSRPEMVKLDRLEAEVEVLPLLSGEVRITRILVAGLDLLAETNADGQGNWAFVTADTERPADPAEGEGSELPFTPVVDAVRIENVRVTYRDGQTGEEMTVHLAALDATTEGPDSPIGFRAEGDCNGAEFTAAGEVGPVMALLQGSAPYPVALEASVFDAEITVDGNIAKPREAKGIDLTISADIENLAETLSAAAAVLPALEGAAAVPATSLTMAAKARDNETGYAVEEIDVKLGESDLTGRVALAMADARPKVEAAFSSNLLDLTVLAPAGEGAAADAGGTPPATPPAAEEGDGRVFPADPLPLEALRAADADVSLEIARLVLPNGMDMAEVAVKLGLDAGNLDLKTAVADLGGGKVDLDVVLDATNDVALSQTGIVVTKVVAGALLDEMGHKDLISEAPIDATIRLDGQGASIRELAAGLNGEILLQVGKGQVNRSAVDLVGADVLSQIAGAVNPLREKRQYTPLSCAVVRFLVEDGMATADKGIAMETDQFVVVGSGAVNLKTEELDLAVKPEAREGLGVSLGGVAGLARVRGTLAEPTVGLDEAAAAKQAASIGAALATGGLSILGEALVNRATRDSHPCQTALGMAPAEPQPAATGNDTTGTGGGGESSPAEKGVKDAVEDIGNALKGLFGGGN